VVVWTSPSGSVVLVLVRTITRRLGLAVEVDSSFGAASGVVELERLKARRVGFSVVVVVSSWGSSVVIVLLLFSE